LPAGGQAGRDTDQVRLGDADIEEAVGGTSWRKMSVRVEFMHVAVEDDPRRDGPSPSWGQGPGRRPSRTDLPHLAGGGGGGHDSGSKKHNLWWQASRLQGAGCRCRVQAGTPAPYASQEFSAPCSASSGRQRPCRGGWGPSSGSSWIGQPLTVLAMMTLGLPLTVAVFLQGGKGLLHVVCR